MLEIVRATLVTQNAFVIQANSMCAAIAYRLTITMASQAKSAILEAIWLEVERARIRGARAEVAEATGVAEVAEVVAVERHHQSRHVRKMAFIQKAASSRAAKLARLVPPMQRTPCTVAGIQVWAIPVHLVVLPCQFLSVQVHLF